jgi:hypothetical protein
MPTRLTLTTTAERLDALRRHLAHEYLGHTKDEGLIRELLTDIAQALSAIFPTKQ